MSQPVIILGGGGHAKVLAEILLRLKRNIIGFTDPDSHATLLDGVSYLGSDDIIFDYAADEIMLVNGLGSVGDTSARQRLFSGFTAKTYRFTEIIHPHAIVSSMALESGQGCQFLAGAIVNPGSHFGDNVLINSRALVEHDCRVGSHVHISPGAVVCGNCTIGDGVHIGAGAVVIQGVTIGPGAIIAAGSVVITDVKPLTLIAGVPGVAKRTLHDKDLARHHS